MTRFWWVNHKQTSAQELGGGYLWSPKKERDGRRSQFYDNLRLASPGDFVISYANRNISGIGIVSDFAITSPTPVEFGAKGDLWNDDGWLLPVSWTQGFQRKSVDFFIAELLPLLPSKYSPFDRNGRGAQKAYLSEIGEDAFKLVVRRANAENVLDDFPAVPQSVDVFVEAAENALQRSIVDDTELSSTEKSQLVLARKGQGLFRRNLTQIEYTCRLTSIDNLKLLVASHIKPWRLCTNARERLDGNNGLLLTPSADLLFDRGFMSFADDGRPIFSDAIAISDIRKFNFPALSLPFHRPFVTAQLTYLDFHRESIFLGAGAGRRVN